MHSVFVGDDEDMDPDERRRAHQRWSPPENEVAALVGGPAVVVADGDAAIVLSGVEHYSCGLRFTLQLYRRVEPPMDRARHGFPREVFVGVELADGTRVMENDFHRTGAERFALSQRGGGGGGRTYEMAYWLAPAPPDGAVTVVVHAPDHQLPEGRVVLAADDLAAARARVVELWPWEPDPPHSHEPPPRPTPPAGGWFDHESE